MQPFLDLFESIAMDPGVRAEFPMDILNPDATQKGPTVCLISNKNRIPDIRRNVHSYIIIPTFEVDEVNSYYDAVRLILKTGLSHRVICQDDDANRGVITWELIDSMQTAIKKRRHGRGRLTTLFFGEGALVKGNVVRYATEQDVKMNIMSREDWLSIRAMYRDIGGTLNAFDRDLIVGVDEQRNDCFVRPIRYHSSIQGRRIIEHGLGVLDADRVVLGSF